MRAMLTGALLETTADPSVPVPQPDLSPAAVPDDLLDSGVINAWLIGWPGSTGTCRMPNGSSSCGRWNG
jgi:hypothetical protein